MKILIATGCLIVLLAVAGCAAPQPYQQMGASQQQQWGPLMPSEPSADSTNWGIYMDSQGGG